MENEQKKLINEYATIYGDDDIKSVEYMRKNIAYIVKLNDGKLFAIEKPRITKQFCFCADYNGIPDQATEEAAEEMADHARTSQSYFIKENLKPLINQLKRFDTNIIDGVDDYSFKRYKFLKPYIFGKKYGAGTNRLAYIEFYADYESDDAIKWGGQLATPEEIKEIIKGYNIVISEFKKRLNTYLKKYGLSKVHAWTFYSD